MSITISHVVQAKTIDRRLNAELFATLPGAGPQLAPRLLVAFREERERFQSAQNLLRYSGIAPVKESSGRKSWVHWRWSCPKVLRQTDRASSLSGTDKVEKQLLSCSAYGMPLVRTFEGS